MPFPGSEAVIVCRILTILRNRRRLLTPKAWEIAALAVCLMAMSPSPAWAYIDPGTGSYLFQLVIAGGLAGVYTIRRYWQTLRDWLGRRDVEK